MMKKYIDIEQDRYNPSTEHYWNIPEVEPKDIIYFAHFPDTGYDHESEDMGYFLEIIYMDGDKLKAGWHNPEDWDKIEAFIEKVKVKSRFIKHKVLRTTIHVGYLNKKMLSDTKIEDSFLIYKDKYRVKLIN